MNKDKNALLQFIARRQYLLVWLGVYLFLIAAGIRFDFLISLISATTTVISMIVLDRFLRCVLIRYLLRPHRQLFYYLASFITIYLFVWGIVCFDVSLFTLLKDKGIITLPHEMNEGDIIYPIFKMAVLFLGMFTVTTASYLLSQAKEAKQKTDELRNAKLDMELRYLKAQINPHFLFNALNNIYSLVYTHDENAPESILKLSEMLRYVTDECQTDKISISKEVKYIENFIDFQLMRMENHPRFEFKKEIRNPDFKLPPMIFQPLIENCFKHSRLESTPGGYICIQLIQNEKELVFIAENSQKNCIFNSQSERGGIGIVNVRKRLDLAYGSNYSFETDNNDQFYRIELHIKL